MSMGLDPIAAVGAVAMWGTWQLHRGLAAVANGLGAVLNTLQPQQAAPEQPPSPSEMCGHPYDERLEMVGPGGAVIGFRCGICGYEHEIKESEQ